MVHLLRRRICRMNKQELIEYCESLKGDLNKFINGINVDKIIAKIKQLDESQKVTIPQYVADFITEHKKLGHTLSYSIDACMSDRVAEWYWDNSELFARAWLDGYRVEKEKRYLVKLKGINSESEYLYYGMGSCTWRFREKDENGYYRKKHSRKELEEAGFAEVFDSPLFEVEEV